MTRAGPETGGLASCALPRTFQFRQPHAARHSATKPKQRHVPDPKVMTESILLPRTLRATYQGRGNYKERARKNRGILPARFWEALASWVLQAYWILEIHWS